MKKYGFRDWDSVLAAIGHGGLKEGQVINKLLEELHEGATRARLTDEKVLGSRRSERTDELHIRKSKSGIVVKGIHDVAVRFSKMLQPGSRRRDRRLCDQGTRRYHPPHGLCQYHQYVPGGRGSG